MFVFVNKFSCFVGIKAIYFYLVLFRFIVLSTNKNRAGVVFMEGKKTITMEFEDGEDIMSGLKQAFSENKVQRASIRSVEGKIKEVELSVFGGGIFRKKFVEDEFKVTSLHGVLL